MKQNIDNRSWCKIILPDRVVGGMRNHCHETDVIVKHCYGYYKKECPKICTFARTKMAIDYQI